MKRLESKTKFYKRWWHIRARCTFKWDKDYHRYGAKGIKFHWESYDDFKKDMYESYLAHVEKHGEKNTTIDRIDNDKGYSKENCRWATWEEQYRNLKINRYITYKGKTMIVSDWAREIGMSKNAFLYRLKSGWTIKNIMETPINYTNVNINGTIQTSKGSPRRKS